MIFSYFDLLPAHLKPCPKYLLCSSCLLPQDCLASLARRAEMVASTLNTIKGFSCNVVQGAMYAFPQVSISSTLFSCHPLYSPAILYTLLPLFKLSCHPLHSPAILYTLLPFFTLSYNHLYSSAILYILLSCFTLSCPPLQLPAILYSLLPFFFTILLSFILSCHPLHSPTILGTLLP